MEKEKWQCVVCGGQGVDNECENCGVSKEESDSAAGLEPDNLDWACPGRER